MRALEFDHRALGDVQFRGDAPAAVEAGQFDPTGMSVPTGVEPDRKIVIQRMVRIRQFLAAVGTTDAERETPVIRRTRSLASIFGNGVAIAARPQPQDAIKPE